MTDVEYEVLVSLQQALLGEISSSLRAVTVSINEKNIKFDCYYDGRISDDDAESMSVVETEIMASLGDQYTISYDVRRLDYPTLIPKDARWVYHRKERID